MGEGGGGFALNGDLSQSHHKGVGVCTGWNECTGASVWGDCTEYCGHLSQAGHHERRGGESVLRVLTCSGVFESGWLPGGRRSFYWVHRVYGGIWVRLVTKGEGGVALSVLGFWVKLVTLGVRVSNALCTELFELDSSPGASWLHWVPWRIWVRLVNRSSK